MSADRFELARQALARGDATTARRLIAQLLVADPANEKAWLLMARLSKDREQVIECLERALRINPGNASTISALQAVKRGRLAASGTAMHPSEIPPASLYAPSLSQPAVRGEPAVSKPLVLAPPEEEAGAYRPPRRKTNLALIVGGLVVFFVILTAIIGPRLAPQDPMEEHAILQSGGKWYIPPFSAFQVPGYILGSDQYGRDMLSRILYAIRPTLVMISIVALVRLFLGTLIGLGAGWSERRFGHFLDGLISAALALPVLLVALGAITMIGTESGLITFVIGLSINGWGETARLVRQQTQLIKGQLFVESARSQGASSIQILYRHILRQVMPMVWMLFAFEVSGTLMVTGALGFLGYYIGGDVWIEVADFISRRTSGMPELGQMLATSWVNLLQPWPLVVTGSAVFIIILGFNLLGEGLRSRLNPEFIDRSSIFARLSRRISLWFEQVVSYPASQWLQADRLHPVLVGVVVVVFGGGIFLYQTKIANRFNPSLAAITVPGGQIWASYRIDPYGSSYFNSTGPQNAQMLWQISDSSGFSGSPVISKDGTIYVAGVDSKLIALNPDGSSRWQVDSPAVPYGPLALAADGTIYVTDAKGGLSAFSADGKLLWSYTTDASGKPNHGAIVAPNGNIYYLLETPAGDTLTALSPAGQQLWAVKLGTFGVESGLRLSPDGTQLLVKQVVVNVGDGSIDKLTLPTQGNPLLGNQPTLFTGADGKEYLLAGHTVIHWTQSSLGFNIVNSTNWDYRSENMNQNSGFPVDSGVLPQGNVWLFYSAFFGGTRIFWLSQSGDIVGKASSPFDENAFMVAIDGNSNAYVCGIGFSSIQGQGATMCEAYRPNDTSPLWSYLFPEGTNGVVGAAMAPGRLYGITQDGKLTALGEPSVPAPTPSATP